MHRRGDCTHYDHRMSEWLTAAASAVLTYSGIKLACAIDVPAKWCWTIGVLYNDRSEKMQREFAIRQLAKHEGYRLEKKGGVSYRLINKRLNVVEQIHRAYIIGRLRSALDQTDGAIIPSLS